MLHRSAQGPTQANQILNDTVAAQEPLGVGKCGEAAHLTLLVARRLMGSFGALGRVLGRVVGATGHDVPRGAPRERPRVSGTRRHGSCRCLCKRVRKHLRAPPARPDGGGTRRSLRSPVVVHGAPQLLALPVDRDAAFVQTPRSSESTVPSLHPPGVLGADLPAPLPHRVVRHDAAAVGQQILDILEAQAVSVLHPDGVADAVRRNALPKVAGSSNVQPGIVPRGA